MSSAFARSVFLCSLVGALAASGCSDSPDPLFPDAGDVSDDVSDIGADGTSDTGDAGSDAPGDVQIDVQSDVAADATDPDATDVTDADATDPDATDATDPDATDVTDAELLPMCDDEVMNGDETDVDCGGADCDACDTDGACLEATDCASGVCADEACVEATCEDGVLNGDESDVDCGTEACGTCDDEAICVDGENCTSGVCDAELFTCTPAACDDAVMNGDESAVDCGGAMCAACGVGAACVEATDCVDGACDGITGVCLMAACDDAVLNGDESDVDCGGSCETCADSRACDDAADCASGVCTGGVCQVPTCADSVANGDESDVDCGGSCGTCLDAQACNDATDCGNGVCTDNVCQAPTCSDGARNGVETDVDCGGLCVPCADGGACNDWRECENGVCSDNVCQAPTCDDGTRNGGETAVDCGGSCGATCVAGDLCFESTDCNSGVCTDNVCQAPTCSDGARNGDETGIDCGGSCGVCPLPGRVLVYQYSSVSTAEQINSALSRLGITGVTNTGAGEAAFVAAYDEQPWELVIAMNSHDTLPQAVGDRILLHHAAGRPLIFSYWDLDGDSTEEPAASLRAAFEVTTSSFDSPQDLHPTGGAVTNLFTLDEQVLPGMVGEDIVGDNGDLLTSTGSGVSLVAAGSPTGTSISLAVTPTTIVNGFMLDEYTADADSDSIPDGEELLMNQVRYVFGAR